MKRRSTTKPAPPRDLHEDWSAFLRLLRAERVKFLIVGGHAVAAHGRPRTTVDLDIFVEASPGNARRVLRVLDAFGFGDQGATLAHFSEPDRVTMLGRVPYRIDLLTSIDGVAFADAYANRMTAPLAGMKLPFIGRAELIRNKATAARPKDLADIALLAEVPG